MGRGFSFPCRLAVESLAVADPGAPIEVHLLGDRPDTIHLDLVESMPDVTVIPIDVDALFAEHTDLRAIYDAIPPDAHAARSNLLRYLLLWQRGGVYVDFDVIALKPLADLAGGRDFVGIERVWEHDEARVEGRWSMSMLPGTIGFGLTWFARRVDSRCFGGALRLGERLRLLDPLWSRFQPNNAVIGAAARSPFIGHLLEHALESDPTIRYALGPSLVARVASRYPNTVRQLREPYLYPVPPADSFRFFEDRHLRLRDETALIHYVNSNHRELLASIEPGDERLAERSEVFWRLARNVAAQHRRHLRDTSVSFPGIDS
jgi:hypothetical protein